MKLSIILEKEVVKTIKLSPDNLRVNRESIVGTLADLIAGKVSYSSTPLDTLQLGSGQYMLVDGYHRFLEAVIIGVKSVRIKNDDNLARLYRVFDRTEAWDYDLFKLIEPEELQKLKEELLNKSSMKKHLEKHE